MQNSFVKKMSSIQIQNSFLIFYSHMMYKKGMFLSYMTLVLETARPPWEWGKMVDCIKFKKY